MTHPPERPSFAPVEGGLTHANQLVTLIREHHAELGIGVAGYPEKHPEAPSLDVDLANLRRKVHAGADAVFTQLFFENQNFFEFVKRCRDIGIEVPIVPGIMPITEFARIQRITSLCGAVIPEQLGAKLEAVKDDKPAQFAIGVEFAIQQCRELIDAGVPGMHFYVLNRSEATEQILDSLEIAGAAAA
ncbi:MAG: methylenetetrahydrofolate reductase [Planctomycetaceae bacterium]